MIYSRAKLQDSKTQQVNQKQQHVVSQDLYPIFLS